MRFSAIQANTKIKKIHVKTRLHSIGSHSGSSSVKLASTKNISATPRRYIKASPDTRLWASKKTIEARFVKPAKHGLTSPSKKTALKRKTLLKKTKTTKRLRKNIENLKRKKFG
jgi:hypothetical protein